jgi:hypothetical protein
MLSAALQPRRFASPEERRVDGAIRAASFSRSRSGAPLRPTPFQRRGCGLPVDLLGPCGAFTEPCRPLTFPLSPAGTPESKSFSPDVLSIRQLVLRTFMRLTEAGVELTCWSEDLESPWQYSHHDGPKPENAFCRIGSLQAFTRKRLNSKNRYSSSVSPAPFRLLSIRARTSGDAADFFPASALLPPADLAIDR